MKRAAALFLLGLFSLGVSGARGAPSCEELNELWRTRFHRDFKVQWRLEPFACPSGTAKVAKSLFDLWKAPVGYDYYGWARDLILATTYETDKCTWYAQMSERTLTLCRTFFETDDEGRVGTVVHEAAHARPDDPGHVICTRGRRKGKRACDEALHEDFRGSGYNFDCMYYVHLLESGYPDLDREVIRGYLRDAVLNSFNHVTEEQMARWAR